MVRTCRRMTSARVKGPVSPTDSSAAIEISVRGIAPAPPSLSQRESTSAEGRASRSESRIALVMVNPIQVVSSQPKEPAGLARSGPRPPKGTLAGSVASSRLRANPLVYSALGGGPDRCASAHKSAGLAAYNRIVSGRRAGTVSGPKIADVRSAPAPPGGPRLRAYDRTSSTA
jgi:hypothetical protein